MLRIFLPYEIIFIERNIFHVFCPRKFYEEFSGCLKQFLYKFKSLPYFALTFLTRLTHEYLAATRKADAIYLKFFEDISRDATLNKTVLIFLSDHGIRFGAIRQTSVGKL
jgi:membrane-anchored protein YejM (alkaline phosphatase superfamily)